MTSSWSLFLQLQEILFFQHTYLYTYIQGVSRLVDITAGGDFIGLSDQKISYKHVSDFERLRSYGHFFNFRTRCRVNRVTEPAGG